jgi:hypothetical protein
MKEYEKWRDKREKSKDSITLVIWEDWEYRGLDDKNKEKESKI